MLVMNSSGVQQPGLPGAARAPFSQLLGGLSCPTANHRSAGNVTTSVQVRRAGLVKVQLVAPVSYGQSFYSSTPRLRANATNARHTRWNKCADRDVPNSLRRR